MLCFRKLLVAKIFMDKRKGKYQDFPSRVLCLTVPKKAVGESFSLSLFSCIKKIRMRGLGGVSLYSVEKLLFQCRKISQGNHLGCH